MARISVLFLISLLALVSCDKNTVGSDLITIRIADRDADCMGLAPRKCFQVKEQNAADWHLFYEPIEGFTYEEGYEYVLVMKRESIKNPPADGSSFQYTLINVVSRQKKQVSSAAGLQRLLS